MGNRRGMRNMPQRDGGGGGRMRGGGMGGGGFGRGMAQASMGFSVHMRGLPFKADEDNVAEVNSYLVSKNCHINLKLGTKFILKQYN